MSNLLVGDKGGMIEVFNVQYLVFSYFFHQYYYYYFKEIHQKHSVSSR